MPDVPRSCTAVQVRSDVSQKPALQRMGGRLSSIELVAPLFVTDPRDLVLVEMMVNTSSAYPRQSGLPTCRLLM